MPAAEHDDVVRASFRRQTALFEGEDSPFARRADSPTAWLEPLQPSMVALDVACGAAHVAEQVAPFVHQVVGVDLTPELLALGAPRLREAGITNVLLQLGAATSMPFVDESFDLVFCRSAVHHFGDPVGAIEEMARVCRRGGRVVVSDMVVPDPGVRDAFDALHRRLDPSHARALTADEIHGLLTDRVGPVGVHEQRGPSRHPIAGIMTEVADRDAVLRALDAEMRGGPSSGFAPSADGDAVLVAFTTVVVQATRT